jgi:hypothetical protein
MLEIPLEEFIEEIKAEITLVEEDLAMGWELDFCKLIEEKKLSDELYAEGDGKQWIKLKDESDLFGLADAYIEAIETNRLDEYWKRFTSAEFSV